MHSRYDRQETTPLMSQCNGQNKRHIQPVCHRVQIIGVSGNNIHVKLQCLQARRTTSAAQQTKAQFIQDMSNQYMYFYLTRQEYVKRVAYKQLGPGNQMPNQTINDVNLTLHCIT